VKEQACPFCGIAPVVVREVEVTAGQLSNTATAARQTEARVEYRDRVRTETVTAVQPRWTLNALAGMGTDGHRVYGGAVAYRLAGPLTAGFTATTDKVLLISAGVQF
jgi:hypothetical protein